jgi:hypothetical protein
LKKLLYSGFDCADSELHEAIEDYNDTYQEIMLLLPEDKKYLLRDIDNLTLNISSFQKVAWYKKGFKEGVLHAIAMMLGTHRKRHVLNPIIPKKMEI